MHFPKYELSSFFRLRNKKTKCFLKTDTLDENGYMICQLLKNTGDNQTEIGFHTIVASVFLREPPKDGKKYIANHKNGIKTDNRVSNLEWECNS